MASLAHAPCPCHPRASYCSVHSFADPSSPLSTAASTDQTYFNVGRGGVRASSLPYALKPDPGTGALEYEDVDGVDYLPLCRWGDGDHDRPGGDAGRGARTDLRRLGGYTSVMGDGLLINAPNVPPVEMWCAKASDRWCKNAATCMQPSCTDDEVRRGARRVNLFVLARQHPKCAYHTTYNGLVSLQCNMRSKLFGQSRPYLSSTDKCAPWQSLAFFNSQTGAKVDVAFVRHWSWSNRNRRVYFAVNVRDTGAASRKRAIRMVNAAFDNRRSGRVLNIEVRPTNSVAEAPAGYDPGALDAFTFVYGDGDAYGGAALGGKSRRRVGSTEMGKGSRDYTVFTVNWYVECGSVSFVCARLRGRSRRGGRPMPRPYICLPFLCCSNFYRYGSGARLQPGSTYINKSYMITSNLGSVKDTAGGLVEKTFVDNIGLELVRYMYVHIEVSFVIVCSSPFLVVRHHFASRFRPRLPRPRERRGPRAVVPVRRRGRRRAARLEAHGVLRPARRGVRVAGRGDGRVRRVDVRGGPCYQ